MAPDGPSDQPSPPSPDRSGRTHGLIAVIVVLFIVNLIFYLGPLLVLAPTLTRVSLPYSAFLAQVRSGNVVAVTIAGQKVDGTMRHPMSWPPERGAPASRSFTTTLPPANDPRLLPLLDAHHVTVTATSTQPPWWLSLLGNALPFLLLLGFLGLLGYQSQGAQRLMLGFGQSRAKLYTEERPKVTFADVAGVDEAKAELAEVVAFLRNAQKFRRLGARIPKGVLLVGPPGTGKTLLARAVAGEARVPFFSISATEFVEMFVGVGASRVRDLFAKAKAAAPAIVFVDEIDAVGRQRGGGYGAVNDEREQTLNQLLVEMDGFEPHEALIVIAATNRPDVLDPALLRPGRFDRQVTVDLPDRAARLAILRLYAAKVPLAGDVDLEALARATPGFAGADLANLINEAALAAARHDHAQVMRADVEEALDKIVLGVKRSTALDEAERRTVAYHEAGHALVACVRPKVDPVQKVTIVPRGRSLGVTQFLPLDDKHNYPRSYLIEKMAAALGGRAAEELVCGEITSGAENDLKEVTRMARRMVLDWGMSGKLGPLALNVDGDGRRSYLGPEPVGERSYSEETGALVDAEIRHIAQEAYTRAQEALRTHEPALHRLAGTLLEQEVVEREQIAAIIAAPSPVAPAPTGATGDGAHRSAVRT